jgi:hypothetical protein
VSKTILSIVGVIGFLLGLIWIGQGTGAFPYPAASPMINQSPWIWYGAVLSLAGLAIFWLSRRMR